MHAESYENLRAGCGNRSRRRTSALRPILAVGTHAFAAWRTPPCVPRVRCGLSGTPRQSRSALIHCAGILVSKW